MCLHHPVLPHSERERIEKEVKTKTISLWSLILSNKSDFENPLYSANTKHHVLFPRTSMRHLCLWDKYYCRWNPSMRQQVRISHFSRFLFSASYTLLFSFSSSDKCCLSPYLLPHFHSLLFCFSTI